MKGQIKTDELRRLVRNAQVYALKSSSVKGYTLWIRGAVTLRVVSTDDFIVLTDEAETVGQDHPGYYLMSHQRLSDLAVYLQESQDELYDLDQIPFEQPHPGHLETLTEADQMVFEVDHLTRTPVKGLCIHPERLKKLNLVKPGGYPIDLVGFNKDGSDLVAFKIGPTVQGLIAPLDRDELRKMYTGGELWD